MKLSIVSLYAVWHASFVCLVVFFPHKYEEKEGKEKKKKGMKWEVHF